MAPPEQDRLLRIAYESGRSEHPDLGLDYGTFAARVVELVRARLERAGVAATRAGIEEVLPRLAAADLFLAIACDGDLAGAWARLVDRHGDRLRSLARRLGVSAADADEVAQDVTSEVSMPAAKTPTRTVLGTFDGSGSLQAWLSVILRRRIADRHRGQRPASLDESDIESRAAAGPDPARGGDAGLPRRRGASFGRPGRPTSGYCAMTELHSRECPDPNLVAAFVDGWLLDEEQRSLEDHLGSCRACREVVADLSRSATEVERRVGPVPLRWPKLVAAAAVVVVAWTAIHRHGAAWDRTYGDLAGWIGREEVRDSPADRQRGPGTIVVLHPRGRVLDRRPLLAWEPVPGIASYDVRLTKGGDPVYDGRTRRTELRCPIDLERGVLYRLELRCPGCFDSRPFRVASTGEVAAWEETRRSVEAAGPRWLAPLRRVRAAFERQHYRVAEMAATAFFAARRGSRLAGRVLRLVRRRLGYARDLPLGR